MKTIVNSIIPFGSYKAITIWPFVFARKELTKIDEMHEGIHLRQQAELLVIPFFILYVLEWAVRLIIYRDGREAYRNISFEQEAYMHQSDISYPDDRRHYAWAAYIGRKTYHRKK